MMKKIDCTELLKQTIHDDPKLQQYANEFDEEYELIKRIVEQRKELDSSKKL